MRSSGRWPTPLTFALVLLAVLAAIALGIVAIIAGEADDSPGLQGLGCLLIIGATVAALRWQPPTRERRRREQSPVR